MAALALLGPATARAGDLHAGDRSPKVATIQRWLHLKPDHVYGPATRRAVKRFQRRHGLTADGIVGPATWSALGHSGRTIVLKRRGARGGRSSSSIVARVIRAADRIATTPYKYGGGHASFDDTGYDCSGSVSYALHGGGLLSSPLDSSGFMT
jgi:peptidoglycan hydrolase-like protein with peptidoglycan-binding domain